MQGSHAAEFKRPTAIGERQDRLIPPRAFSPRRARAKVTQNCELALKAVLSIANAFHSLPLYHVETPRDVRRPLFTCVTSGLAP
jgi:hypothetical protein